MGIFSKAKEQYQALQEQAAAMSGVDPVSDIPAFVAPWPQEEVDRLLQGTGTLRAIVFGKRHHVLEDGERVGRMRVDVRLRPRGPDGTLGDEVTLKASVSSWVATLIERGLDIPVERDPATGKLTRVASKQLTEELTHRKAEADAIRPGWAVAPEIQGMAETAVAVKDAFSGKPKGSPPAPPATPQPVAASSLGTPPASVNEPRPAPLSGVSWQQYVAVCAYLQAHPEYSSSGEADAAAQLHGVPPYTWLAISNAWGSRVAADPSLVELFEWDVAVARQALG